MRKKLAMSAAVAVATVTGLIAGSGTANADTDSYTQHSVEIGAYNQYSDPYAYICNHQSATNSYEIGVWALHVYPGTGGGDWVTLEDSQGRTHKGYVTTPPLTPGSCAVYSFTTYVGYSVQVGAKSGSNWWFGTNAIAYGPA